MQIKTFQIKALKEISIKITSKIIPETMLSWILCMFNKMIRRPIKKIIKIIHYLPILWRDEDWDWMYIMQLLSYKLKRTRLCILNNQFIENSQLIHDEILEVEKCFERLLNDDYCAEEMEKIDKKWRHYEFIGYDSETGQMISNTKTKAEEHLRLQKCEDYDKVYTDQETAIKQDLEKAFSIMTEKIRNWWD